MIKTTLFLDFDAHGWPSRSQLAPYFLTPAGRKEAFATSNDCWEVAAEGLEGTEHLPWNDRYDIQLTFIGKPDLGVLLDYERWDGKDGNYYYSKGDMTKLYNLVKIWQGGRRPSGLFIPFERALDAVMEFIETEGALPKCIEWVAAGDLPQGIFPDPVVTFRNGTERSE